LWYLLFGFAFGGVIIFRNILVSVTLTITLTLMIFFRIVKCR
jgi:hypothetical protein